MPSFHAFYTFLLEVCILVHGAEKSCILLLEQSDTRLLPSHVTVTCAVHREEKQAMLHQLLSVG